MPPLPLSPSHGRPGSRCPFRGASIHSPPRSFTPRNGTRLGGVSCVAFSGSRASCHSSRASSPPPFPPSVGATGGTAPDVQRFLKIRTPASPSLLPDGTLLVRDWPDGIWQLYRVTPGTGADGAPSYDPAVSTRVQLTDFPDGLSGYTLSPDNRWVVLMHARGGNENTQLTLMDLTAPVGGGMRPVLDNPAVQASVNAWFRDGTGFIYSANDESPNDFHLYRYDIAGGKTTRLLARTGSWRAGDATLDKSRVLVQEYVSASDSRVYELNVATGKLRDLTIAPKGGTASCEIAGYMPDERDVLLRSDIENGLHRLYLKSLGSGKVRQPIPFAGRIPAGRRRRQRHAPLSGRIEQRGRLRDAARLHLTRLQAGDLASHGEGPRVWPRVCAATRSSGRSTTRAIRARRTRSRFDARESQGDAGHAPGDMDRRSGSRSGELPPARTHPLPRLRRSPDPGVPLPAAGPRRGDRDPLHRLLPRRPRRPDAVPRSTASCSTFSRAGSASSCPTCAAAPATAATSR